VPSSNHEGLLVCCCCGGGGGGAVHVSSVAVSVVFAEGGAELVVGVVVLLTNLRVEVLSSVFTRGLRLQLRRVTSRRVQWQILLTYRQLVVIVARRRSSTRSNLSYSAPTPNDVDKCRHCDAQRSVQLF